MNLEILTPDRLVFNGPVDLVQVPGTMGSFAILENHAPVISSLTTGTMRYIEPGGRETSVNLSGGVVEVRRNMVTVLADSIINP